MWPPDYNRENVRIFLKLTKELSTEKILSQRKIANSVVGKVRKNAPITTLNNAVNGKTGWKSITKSMFEIMVDYIKEQSKELKSIDMSVFNDQSDQKPARITSIAKRAFLNSSGFQSSSGNCSILSINL